MIRRLKEAHVEELERQAAEQCENCIRTLMKRTVKDMLDADSNEFKITLNIVAYWEGRGVLAMETTAKSETKLTHTDETDPFKLNTDPKQMTLPGTEE